MHTSDHTQDWFIDIITSDLFQQIAPVLVFFILPALILLVTTTLRPHRLFYHLSMGLESIGLSLSWMFHSGSKSGSSTGHSRSSSSKKSKKPIRTRADQLAQNGTAHHGEDRNDEGCYPGLVNISGTYCFMNSTLQALASLTYLQPHIDTINAKAEALDVPTPVIDALRDLFQRLNKPHSSYHAIRPTDIIQALSSQTEGRTNSLFYSREHQDAQELFQVISECIKNEITAVDKEAYRDRGLGGLANVSAETMRDIGKSVFDGLTANRRSCCICGYTEAVMHFALDNWQLAVPRLTAVCRLEDCLEDYTRLEVLKDCICRKCSIIATHKRLQQDLLKLEHEISTSEKKPSNSKKERLKKLRKMETKVRQAIDEERIEDDLKDIRMEKVFSPASTKQAMIARPPPVLALHINRSVHYGHYASKNNVRLLFPEVLDLTPYTTSGNLSTVPTSAISTPPPALPRSTTPTPSTYAHPRIIYRLSAVVCHYGQHSFGHYICYRRKPRSPNLGPEKRWEPPKIVDPLMSWEEEDGTVTNGDVDVDGSNGDIGGTATGPRYTFADTKDSAQRPGKGWLRISDDSVRECGIETVLQEGAGAFMLYYERAVFEQSGVYSSEDASPRSSEETLKPESRTVNLNGSVASLVSEVGVGVKHHHNHHRHHPHPYSRSNSQRAESSSSSILPLVNGNADARKERPVVAPVPIIGLSSSLSQSQYLHTPGARIVRNVTSRRSRSAVSRSNSNSMESTPAPEANGHAGVPIVNGLHHEDLSASAPVLMPSYPLSSSSPLPSKLKPKAPLSSSSSSQQNSIPRIHSPKPHHPPNGTPVVGLKA